MRLSRIRSWALTCILFFMVNSMAFAFTFTNVGVPDAVATYSLGINARGQIVGYYWDGDNYHGFILDKGVFTTIDAPGAVATYPSGINARGQIVGYYWDGDYIHSFLLDKGVFKTIDAPDAIITYATGIDDSGRILGYYWNADGNQHGFLVAP